MRKSEKFEIYIPIYHRPPNKFISYREEQFNGGTGNVIGTERIAIFKDKKGRIQEMTAQIIWEDGVW